MTMPPHWLDAAIERSLRSGERDPRAVGQAIGESEQFQEAIRAGLAENVQGRLGLSSAQMVRQAIMEALESSPVGAQEPNE